MGSTARAYTIVGSLVDIDDFFNRVNRDIHHECETAGPGPRCSTCGDPLGATEFVDVPVDGFDPEGGEDEQGTINGVDLFFTSCNGRDHHFVPAEIVTVKHWDDEGNDHGRPEMLELVDLVVAMDKVRSVLEPAGLWDPKSFGIWTALDC